MLSLCPKNYQDLYYIISEFFLLEVLIDWERLGWLLILRSGGLILLFRFIIIGLKVKPGKNWCSLYDDKLEGPVKPTL